MRTLRAGAALAALLLTCAPGAMAAQALATRPDLPLIPWPRSVERDAGSFRITRTTQIVAADPRLAPLAASAADLVEAELGWRPAVARRASGAAIVLALAPDTAGGPESYRLTVRPGGIGIRAPREQGLFYGLQTLRQLLGAGATVPAVRIADAPRFRYRGMHLDVARHFFPVDFVKRYIDLLSRYKINTFHWHLTDDQGWRLEIRRYPRLTSIGAWRKESILEKHFDPYRGDGTPHGGFYTQDEVRDVVRHAAARHVTIVPEIEMPGHAQAAIAAHPSLACTKGPFEVSTVWGVDEDIFCPSEATFQFLQNVLTEVMELFPGRYIHIGGDEAPKRRWKESPVAQAIMRRERLRTEEQLQSWFVRRIERFLSARGRRLIGWDEILEGGLAPQATVMSWRGMDGGIAAARQGHDVIMTPGSHLYFDHAQGDPELEPLSIGGNTTLERVYGFEPVPPALTRAQARHILGAQANMWTEYLTTPAQVEFMMFPRLLALAEVVWSPKSSRDWEHFTSRLPAALGALDRLDVNYRVPHPEGLESDRLTLGDTAVVELTTLLPGASEIRYTLDGTMPDSASPRYAAPLRIPVARGAVRVTARVFTPDGRASPPRSASVARTSLRPAEAVDTARLKPGLEVAYHEASLSSARSLERGRAKSVGVADSVGLQGRERAEGFGLRFTGFVRVPADGVYAFTLDSDDGSVLRIGNEEVVDNDGMHSEKAVTGMVALAAGLHPITIEYVQGGGGSSLRAFVEREGGARERLAGSLLAHLPD